MRVVVPFAGDRPKTRLAALFESDERVSFASVMLADVLAAVEDAGFQPSVLATGPLDLDVPVIADERPLSIAVNAILASSDEEVAVVMADLALATGDVLRRLFETPGDIVVAPGRGGGTNALVVRHDEFRVDYHGASYLDHLTAARDVGATVTEFDSHRLSTDIDEPDDLPEVLLHGDGAAPTWLRDAGFELAVDGGRVSVTRMG